MAHIVGRRGGTIIQNRAARRKTFWDGGTAALPFPGSFPDFGNNAVASTVQLQALEPRVTLIRTRGFVTVSLSVAATALALVEFAFGMILVNDNAGAAGVGSIPDPFDDPSAPWIVHRYGTVMNIAAGGPDNDLSSQRFEIDSKAKRVVIEGERLVWVARGSGGAGDTLIATGVCRILSLLV